MRWISLVLVLILAATFSGCGGSSNNNSNNSKPAITVSLTPGTAVTIVQGQQKGISAILANDTAAQGVTWAMSGSSCSGSACGTFTTVTTSAAMYNAPASVTANMTVTIVATAAGDTTKTASVTITVMPTPSITTTSLPNGIQGSAYTATTLTATGGISPLTWSISAGSLPAGLALSGGVISGTPTAVGTANFTVQVADASTPAFTATKALSIVIAPPQLTIITTTLPAVAINSGYSATLQSSGGTAPVGWSVTTGTLPPGLTLHSGTGVIDGTPTVAGTTNFTVTATDAGTQTKTQALAIVVNPVLSIVTASLPDGAMHTAYSATLAASGGTAPVAWSVSSGSLPAGLTLNGATGVISGSPTSAGNVSFSVSALDSSTPQQTVGTALSILVAAAPLAISSTTLPTGTLGTAYSFTLNSTGGTPPVAWSVTAGSLPGWATLNTSTGAITGTPTGSPVTTTFTVTATDNGAPVQTKSQALSLVTVTGGVNNAELNGHYAFMMRGFYSVNGEAITTAGSFTADGNGNVTGGVVDVNTLSSHSFNLAITGGFYSVGADQRGTMSLTTASGTTNYAFSLGGITSGIASMGHIVGADTQVISGSIKKQDTSAFSTNGSSGAYAVGLAGTVSSGRFAAAGRIVLDGTGSFTAAMDFNEGGTVSQQSFIGTYAINDSVNGRGTFNDTTNGSHMILYVISATELFVINVDPFSNNGPPIFTGSALKQSGTFSNASMNAISVAAFQGQNTTGGYAAMGLLNSNGSGGLTGLIDENDGGVILAQGTYTASYSVDATGRVVVASSGHPPILYLVSANKGFWLGTGSGVQNGFFEPQTGSSFSNASISGNYIFGSEPIAVNGSNVECGFVSANGAGTVTGTSDHNSGGSLTINPFTDGYTVSSNGRVVLTDSVMYLISPSRAVMMQTNGEVNPTITVVDK